jgi:DNA processing protein
MSQRDDLAYWLALNRAPGLGPVGLRTLFRHQPEPRLVFKSTLAELRELGLQEKTLAYLAAPDWAAVDQDLAWATQARHHLVTLSDDHYPPRLREIADPPLVLFVLGELAVLLESQVAVVGSRNPTPTATETTFELAKQLSRCGVVVTSGLALGIDGVAHRGALEGGGKTVAVLGSGPDRIYPARHAELAARVVAAGALVTEFPPGTPPRSAHFPRRNRVISGLSLGVLVTEAAARSGALITARLAAEQGREVFAVPGSIYNPLSRGCHALIRQGAKLVEGIADILEEIAPQIVIPHSVPGPGCAVDCPDTPSLGKLQAQVLAQIAFEPLSVDAVVERTGLTPEVVSSILCDLELQGVVSALPGARYARAAKKG